MWGRLSFVDFEDGGSHIARTVGTVQEQWSTSGGQEGKLEPQSDNHKDLNFA